MSACTFWGHRDCPDEVYPELKSVLTWLIEERGIDLFYAGNEGKFDRIVRRTLRELHSSIFSQQFGWFKENDLKLTL